MDNTSIFSYKSYTPALDSQDFVADFESNRSGSEASSSSTKALTSGEGQSSTLMSLVAVDSAAVDRGRAAPNSPVDCKPFLQAPEKQLQVSSELAC